MGADKPPAIRFPECERSGRRVFELKHAVKCYGALTVYDGVDMTIERGARVALVGPNGSGKSTMMRLLAGVDSLTAGERIVGHNVRIGYFAQDLAETLDYQRTVLDELSDAAEGMTSHEIRGLLGAMLFSGDDAGKRAGVLSGGERARLALAKVLAHRNNCLLLDEPTNNLDIIAKETLLEALRRFNGTVVIVSHDRYILNELVTEVIEVGRGHATRYLGNYDEYLAKTQALGIAAAAASAASPLDGKAAKMTKMALGAANDRARHDGKAGAVSAGKPDRARKPDRDRKRTPNTRRRAALESDIERMEAERAALAAEMNDPDFYLARKDADQMIARHERLGREVEQLYSDLLQLDDSPAARDET